MKIVEINEKKCIGCARCVVLCPQHILYMENNKCKVTNEKKCDKLRGCERVCPVNAIKIN